MRFEEIFYKIKYKRLWKPLLFGVLIKLFIFMLKDGKETFVMYQFAEKGVIQWMAIAGNPVNVDAIWVFMVKNVIAAFLCQAANTVTVTIPSNVYVTKDGMDCSALIVCKK